METITFALISIFISIIVYLLISIGNAMKYWKIRGVPHRKPMYLFGNSASSFWKKKRIATILEEICQEYPTEPIIGYYNCVSPQLIINDVHLIEKVLITDFPHFTDHMPVINVDKNPFDENLFMMGGKKWRAFRNKISPLFTAAKLKFMFDALAECGNSLTTLIDAGHKDLEMKNTFQRFSLDVTGSCIFGIDVGNIKQSNNEFYRLATKVFQMDTLMVVKHVIQTISPKLFNYLGLSYNRKEVTNYFTQVAKNTLKYRQENNVKRNDFVQLMMELMERGHMDVRSIEAGDEYLNIEPTVTTDSFEITYELLISQAYSFFSAGFDPVSNVLLFTLYEMCKQCDCQERARKEIGMIVETADKLTYDMLKDMEYLEQCVKETMRKYSPIDMLIRTCTKAYRFPNGLTIEPGQIILIPVNVMHNNARYFPNPQLYKPERFGKENPKWPSCAYMPFGNGPRTCIGMKFGMMQIKFCLAQLLLKYQFELSPKTKEPIAISVLNMFVAPNDPVYFNITPIVKS